MEVLLKVLTKERIVSLVNEFRLHKLTLSFAESCTGGRLSASVTELPGVSDIFLGSVVSYAYQAKVDLLGVSWEALNSEGAVSEIVAQQMAVGCRQKFGSSWSVAITGIAGPAGGTVDKPVGTVWFAACGPEFESSPRTACMQFKGDRSQIQEQSVQFAAEFLVNCIADK